METNKQINSVEKHKTPEPKMCQTEPNSLEVNGNSNEAITFGYQNRMHKYNHRNWNNQTMKYILINQKNRSNKDDWKWNKTSG